MPESLKIWAVNLGVVGVTTLTKIELTLKVLLLTATLVWTVIKIAKALRGKKDEKDDE